MEITICTYNRPEFIRKNLDLNIRNLIDAGISLSVYDSSTDDKTKEIVEQYNYKFNNYIRYQRFDSHYRIDDKVLKAIMDCNCKYSWPIADTLFISNDSFNNNILPYLKQDFDYVCLYNCATAYSGRIYLDSYSFVYDCFWHATWLGGIIFRKDLFASLNNKDVYNDFRNKYNKNDGFSYLGIFYDLIAGKKLKGVFSTVRFVSVGGKKEQAWLKRYLDVWCGNLCFFVDSIDKYYDGLKDKVIKETWLILRLNGFYWNYKARLAGGLNTDVYNYYNSIGYIDRVTSNKSIMCFCAKAPVYILTILYYLTRVIGISKKLINRIIKVFNKNC